MSRIFPRSPNLTLPVAKRGEGCYLIDSNGKRYFDASGGAAVSCLGHSHPDVIAAMKDQLDNLEYAHTSFFTTEAAETLADTLVANSPDALAHVYFVSGGSEAVEAAMKMARQYHVENGQPSRYRFIARRQSYHGNTIGALSIGGNMARRKLYEPIMMESHHVSPCFAFRYREPGETDAAYVTRLAVELDNKILELGPETVAAFVAETVVGATAGAVAPVADYFKQIRAVCDRHGVLLILDEVMAGVGRTGSYHAFEQEGVVPDLLTLAKGLGGGYQPIGAVMASARIFDTISRGSGAFQHGHTYIGHAVACSAALAVQRVMARDGLVARSGEYGKMLGTWLHQRFDDHPQVADIRGRGMFWAIELVADRNGNRPFAPASKVHAKIKTEAQARGLLCYPGGGTIDGELGDHVLLAPPFIASAAQLEFVVATLADALDAVTAGL